MLDANVDGEDTEALTIHSFKKYLYNLYLSRKKHKKFEQIDKAFSSPPFNYGHISFSKEDKKLDIEVKEKDFRLPIKHLGSGVLQALYIITSIVCSKSKIICIEELEQNLSPSKQGEILEKIQGMIKDKSEHNLDQIIISSHSIIYSEPKLGAIYLVEKDKNGYSIVNPKEKGRKISSKLIKHFDPVTRNPYLGSQPI